MICRKEEAGGRYVRDRRRAEPQKIQKVKQMRAMWLRPSCSRPEMACCRPEMQKLQ